MTEEKIYKLTKILSYIGILLAMYLLYNFISRPAFQPCSINEQINCDAVTKGSISTFAGIPVPLVGLVGYIVILISAFLKKPKLVLFMSAFGTLFCLRLTFIEIFELHVICPVCLACQIVMITILVLGYLLNKSKPKIEQQQML